MVRITTYVSSVRQSVKKEEVGEESEDGPVRDHELIVQAKRLERVPAGFRTVAIGHAVLEESVCGGSASFVS